MKSPTLYHLSFRKGSPSFRERIAIDTWNKVSSSSGVSVKFQFIEASMLPNGPVEDHNELVPLPLIPDLFSILEERESPEPQDLVLLTNADCPVREGIYDFCQQHQRVCFFRLNGPDVKQWPPPSDFSWELNTTGVDGFCMLWHDWKSFEWPDACLGEVYWDPLYLELMRERLGAVDNTSHLLHVSHPVRTSTKNPSTLGLQNQELLREYYQKGKIHALRCSPLHDTKIWERPIESLKMSEVRSLNYCPTIVPSSLSQENIMKRVNKRILWDFNLRTCRDTEWPCEAASGVPLVEIPGNPSIRIPCSMLHWYSRGTGYGLGSDVVVYGLWGSSAIRWSALSESIRSLQDRNNGFSILVVSEQEKKLTALRRDHPEINVLQVPFSEDTVFCKEALWNAGGSYAAGAGAERLYFLDCDCLFCEVGQLDRIRMGLELNPFAIGQVGKFLFEKTREGRTGEFRYLWGSKEEDAEKGKPITHFSPGLSACLGTSLFFELEGFSIAGVPFGGDHMWMAETNLLAWSVQKYERRPFLKQGIRAHVHEKASKAGVSYFAVGEEVEHFSHSRLNYNALEKRLVSIKWSPSSFFLLDKNGFWKKHLDCSEYEKELQCFTS